MAIPDRLKAFLAASKIPYTVDRHPVVYTAQEIAAAQHVPGGQFAKSVLVNTARGPVLAVLPAVQLIDLKRLKSLLRATTASIAKEADIKRCFPDVEVGAMPPFGNLYEIPVVVDQALTESEYIVFNAGSHTETMRMRSHDFAALVHPKVGTFGQPIPGAKKPSRAKATAARAGRRTTRAAPGPSERARSTSQRPSRRRRR